MKINSNTMTNGINKVIDQTLANGKIVGTSVVVAKHGQVIFERHAGFANQEAATLVSANTIFRFASMTKPIVSATTMALIERGMLDLDDNITKWLPNFTPTLQNGTEAIITIRHLLTHTSGLTHGFLDPQNEPYKSAGISEGLDDLVPSIDENLQRLAQVPLSFNPGTNWGYSLATDVLGAILEKICNKPLSDIVADFITTPLAMHDTVFHIDTKDEKYTRLSMAYADSDDGSNAPKIMKEQQKVLFTEGGGFIHYTPSRITNNLVYNSGGAGMAGTARDYIKFLELIRTGGGGIINANSVNLMTSDQVPTLDVAAAGPGYGFGMGFAIVRDSKIAGTPRKAGSFEWGGVYGSKMFVDPKSELSVVMLTNTAIYGLMGSYPNDLTKAIYEAFCNA